MAKSACPVTREEFKAKAKSVSVSVEGVPLTAELKEFSTGSFGWYLNGKIVVTGHTDGRDARTARLPSAWHQSFEWAREAAGGLARTLPLQRLAVEGAADFDDAPAGASAPALRRVDIVLYP